MSLTKTELKKVRALQTKKGRRTTGEFVAEGVRLLEEAVRHKTLPRVLYYAPALLSERGQKLVDRFEAKDVKIEQVSSRDLDRISGTEAPSGILGVFKTPRTELAKLYRPRMRNILLCENLSDPGNVGTVCRSALAFAFDLVILSGSSVEPYAPKVVRASAGALFALPVAVATVADVLVLAGKERLAIVTTDLRGEDRLEKVLPKLDGLKLLLALGSEANGLSPEILEKADFTVRLRHERAVESLNAAVAGSILMKECYDRRQRRRQ